MKKIFALTLLLFSLAAQAQVQLAKEMYSTDYFTGGRYMCRLLMEDENGYYLLTNDNNLQSYKYVNHSFQTVREATVTNNFKRTRGRQPLLSFFNSSQLIEISRRRENTEADYYYAQKINLNTLQPEGEAPLLYSSRILRRDELMRDDNTLIDPLEFGFSDNGFCMMFYSPDSLSLRNDLLRYELYFSDTSLKVISKRVIQMDEGYMLLGIQQFRNGQALVKWRKRVNPQRESDLLMVVSSQTPGLRYIRPEMGEKEVHDFYVQELSNGNLAVCGYYIDPKLQATAGLFLFLYEPQDLKLIRNEFHPADIKFHYAGATPAQRASREFLHTVSFIYEADSNQLVLIGEYHSYEEPQISFWANNWQVRSRIKNQTAMYIHGACFAYCITPEGRMKWASLIPVNQTGAMDEREFMGITHTFQNNALFVVYNDHPDGHIKSGVQQNLVIANTCQQTLVRIDSNGKMRKEQLTQQLKRQRTMPLYSFVTRSGMLLVNRTVGEYNFLHLNF
ncbi:MAG: hypothetical protein MUC87_11195 [Bacteroidia bacterium]|jgi:hypothetical protein|nr:hypothetical protein [Bacteroidia bacterium]